MLFILRVFVTYTHQPTGRVGTSHFHLPLKATTMNYLAFIRRAAVIPVMNESYFLVAIGLFYLALPRPQGS